MATEEEDLLLQEQIQEQLSAALEAVGKLEERITTMVDEVEQEAARTEVKRLLAERSATALQKEANDIDKTGKAQTDTIVSWWVLGSFVAWCIGIVLSTGASPVLGFIIFVPIVAISLILGYTSLNVDHRVQVDMKRARARSREDQPLVAADADTKEFITQLCGPDDEAAASRTPQEQGDGGGGSGALVVKVVTASAGLVYNVAVLGVRAAGWLMGVGGAGGGDAKAKTS